MSLINQLLQDLEKRHASGQEVKRLSGTVRPLPHSSRRRIYLLLAVGLLAVAAAAALLFSPEMMESMPSPPATPFVKADDSKTAETPDVVAPVMAAIPQEPPAPELALPVFQMVEELARLPEAVAPEPKPQSKPEPKPKPQPEPAAKPKPKKTSPASLPVVPEAAVAKAAPAPSPPTASEPPIEQVSITPSPDVTGVGKQMREPTAYERAEIEFRQGVARLRQGRVSDAEGYFREALKQDPSHSAARQALISLLVDAKRYVDTEELLRETLSVNPRQPKHAMLLARLQLERQDLSAALTTLESVKRYAGVDPGYLAFLAAAYQRAGRHKDAVEAYRSALTLAPGNAVWLIGTGISLQALNQREQAAEVFRAAAESGTLPPELQTFADLRLRELAAAKR